LISFCSNQGNARLFAPFLNPLGNHHTILKAIRFTPHALASLSCPNFLTRHDERLALAVIFIPPFFPFKIDIVCMVMGLSVLVFDQTTTLEDIHGDHSVWL
jgi:hypothetical protein